MGTSPGKTNPRGRVCVLGSAEVWRGQCGFGGAGLGWSRAGVVEPELGPHGCCLWHSILQTSSWLVRWVGQVWFVVFCR